MSAKSKPDLLAQTLFQASYILFAYHFVDHFERDLSRAGTCRSALEQYLRPVCELLLGHLATTPDEAFSGIRRLVSDCLTDMRAGGRPVPEGRAGSLDPKDR